MRRRRPDMDAIAQKLGVSKTTVHYALRNTGRVGDAMRKRVLAVAAELGYRPNQVASSLRSRRSSTVGVVVVSLTSSFHAHVLEGIDAVAQEEKHGILLACSYGNAAKERSELELFLEKGVDGLILVPADPEENRDYYKGLLEEGIPLVFVDRTVPKLNVDSVAADHLTGGYMATQHLIESGRKRVAFLTTNSRDRRSTSVLARLNGCNRALQEAGLEPAILLGPNVPDKVSEEEFGHDAVRDHLKRGGARFDALFAVHDGLAYGAVEALKEGGLEVPRDVAVVGFDDQDPSAYYSPPLTTIRQPMRQIGEEAMRLLFRRMSEKEEAMPRQRLSLEPTLIVRMSSHPATPAAS
jgi:LacI family transcriptional regulator